jgi:small-conductance mechanosensitive channel
MFIDNMVGIWPSFGLDYSTHTAVSLSIALSLCVLVLKARTIMACTFLMYMLLMLYQEYHTALDIVTTMAPMLFVAAISHRLLFGTARNRNPSLPEC